jgi:DNA-directed RNA polymerase specialized sigma24 family protein
MPGGRLTHQDREGIASGLARGHGYAEIARLLGRPTSTVSREVARNGGPDGYRADRAHRDSGRRAARHRHKPRAVPPMPPAATPDPDVADAYAERFAAMMIETGVPRMMARILVSLLLSETGGLTAAELVQRLEVSPASVSKAVPYLEKLQLVRRERVPGQRRERYVADGDMWIRTWQHEAKLVARWAEMAGEGADLFGTDTPNGARLAEFSGFMMQIREDILELAARWQERRAGRQAAPFSP